MALIFARSQQRLCSKFGHLKSRFSTGAKSDKKGLVLGVYTNKDNSDIELTTEAAKYNQQLEGKLSEKVKLVQEEIKPGKSFIFWGLDPNYHSVAVVGLGEKCVQPDDIELIDQQKENVRIAASAGCRSLDAAGIKKIEIESFCDAESAAEGSHLGTWKFQEYKTKKDVLPNVQLFRADQDICAKWLRGVTKAEAQNVARKLADTPSNLLTPTIFAEQVQNMLTSLGIDVKVYEKQWAEKQKMFSFLSVAKGSVEAPKFLEITYTNTDKDIPPYVLVGKGVTFDSGGISIKPSTGMDEMRGDMGGAAAVVGTVFGLAKLKTPVNLKILIPLVENMPSGSATKPGDVFTARNGKTICVNNTDAEGRLILADALCYSGDFKPKWVLDIATLTGAMSVALGNAATGVFSNSNNLYNILENAGCRTGDRVWRMPLWKHYTKQVAENQAYDLNNISNKKGGGSCTAAAFLREFVPEKTDWLHLDIAGVMGVQDDSPYLHKGMTGRPSRTLIEFIDKQSSK